MEYGKYKKDSNRKKRSSSKQKVRRSQFVLVYGPGSIIEGQNGSRLIPSLKALGKENCNDAFFTKYEIKDVRMSHMLNKKNDDNKYEYHLLSIPSNDSIDDDEPRVIYSTAMFPAWHLCYKRNPPILYFDKINDEHCSAYDEKDCGECEKEKNPNVRFVRACPNGHLDEVNWYSEVHHGKKGCTNKYHFHWNSIGSSLKDIIIECPDCKENTTMELIYKNKNSPCTARVPENEEFYGSKILSLRAKRTYECDEYMTVIQKQSSSLRLPNTRTLLKIPTFDESILDIFNNSNLKSSLDTLKAVGSDSLSKQQFKDLIFQYLDHEEFWKLEEYLEDHEISQLFEQYDKIGQRKPEFSNAVDEEFKAIREGELETANFARSDFTQYDLHCQDYNLPLDVCAIYKLTTVTAQISYQRTPRPKRDKKTKEIIENTEFIPVGYLDEDVEPKKLWYPAYMGVGEGIFLTSKKNPFDCSNNLTETIRRWETCKVNSFNNSERPETENPLFVWWHTLSHAIIKSLSLSCGYSSASLHERVYLDEKTKEGGILIYNTSPGDDSGMGGLVDLVFDRIEFEKVLKNAMNSLLVCSNDPLCSSVKLEDGGVNGSACHNCLLVSETSCEHQNSLLDRNFFIN